MGTTCSCLKKHKSVQIIEHEKEDLLNLEEPVSHIIFGVKEQDFVNIPLKDYNDTEAKNEGYVESENRIGETPEIKHDPEKFPENKNGVEECHKNSKSPEKEHSPDESSSTEKSSDCPKAMNSATFSINKNEEQKPSIEKPSKHNAGVPTKNESEQRILPLIKTNHEDLCTISRNTLQKVLKGQTEIKNFTIVDCRYPYEYLNGHIKSAINIYEFDGLRQYFFSEEKGKKEPTHKGAIIFHCEFSAVRAPRMYRRMQSIDFHLNSCNTNNQRQYPELYLLGGGYYYFFERYKELCEPQGYVKMHDEAYASDREAYKNLLMESLRVKPQVKKVTLDIS